MLGSCAIRSVAQVGKTVFHTCLPSLDALRFISKELRDAIERARILELHHHVKMRGCRTSRVRRVAVVHDARIALRGECFDSSVHFVHKTGQVIELLLVHHRAGLHGQRIGHGSESFLVNELFRDDFGTRPRVRLGITSLPRRINEQNFK